MIDLRKKAIELEENKWKKFKLKLGFTEIPDYACSTINDFLENKEKICIGKTVLFPCLDYIPLNYEERDKLGEEIISVNLKDATGKIEVYIRPMMNFGFVAENLKSLWAGGKICNVEIQNGVQWPEEIKPDKRIYLTAFKFQNGMQKEFSTEIPKIIEKLFPNYNKEPTTIKK
ncbi:MAG: hypothetical protein WC812_01540 [Candidatus Pacearchaeota archaeon]|jgi:hypothetical protein